MRNEESHEEARKPVGLCNYGNICYFNAVLQVWRIQSRCHCEICYLTAW